MKFKLNTPFVCWNVGEIPVNGNLTHRGVQHAGCVLVTKPEDLAAIATAYAHPDTRPLMVDSDHLSEDPTHNTQALGWVLGLSVQGGELRCNMSPVGDGRRIVEEGVLRYCSPIWNLEYETPDQVDAAIPRMKPVSMVSLGLTNQPRNKTLPPISTPEEPTAPAILHNTEKGGSKPAAITNNTKPTTKPKMNNLAKLLGLPEDATEEQIAAAITALLADLETSQASVANRAKADEDAFFVANKDVIPASQETHFRALYSTSPEGVAGIVAAMRDLKKTAAPTTLQNRTAPVVGTPQGGPPAAAANQGTGAGAVAVFRQYEAMSEGEERKKFYAANRAAILEGNRQATAATA